MATKTTTQRATVEALAPDGYWGPISKPLPLPKAQALADKVSSNAWSTSADSRYAQAMQYRVVNKAGEVIYTPTRRTIPNIIGTWKTSDGSIITCELPHPPTTPDTDSLRTVRKNGVVMSDSLTRDEVDDFIGKLLDDCPAGPPTAAHSTVLDPQESVGFGSTHYPNFRFAIELLAPFGRFVPGNLEMTGCSLYCVDREDDFNLALEAAIPVLRAAGFYLQVRLDDNPRYSNLRVVCCESGAKFEDERTPPQQSAAPASAAAPASDPDFLVGEEGVEKVTGVAYNAICKYQEPMRSRDKKDYVFAYTEWLMGRNYSRHAPFMQPVPHNLTDKVAKEVRAKVQELVREFAGQEDPNRARNEYYVLPPADSARIVCGTCRKSAATISNHCHWNTGSAAGVSFFYFCAECDPRARDDEAPTPFAQNAVESVPMSPSEVKHEISVLGENYGGSSLEARLGQESSDAMHNLADAARAGRLSVRHEKGKVVLSIMQDDDAQAQPQATEPTPEPEQEAQPARAPNMYEQSEHLTCAETAKIVRAALARCFPGVKFSVRSHTYSGGASIDVRWTDGPTTADVEKVAKGYGGGSFDGSIDLQSYHQSWLMPDGSVQIAHDSGTEGSRGVYPAQDNPKPCPGARLVSFGADSVFCQREYSIHFYTYVAQEVSKRYGLPCPKINTSTYKGREYGPYAQPDYSVRIGDSDRADTLADKINEVIRMTSETGPIVWYAPGREPIIIEAPAAPSLPDVAKPATTFEAMADYLEARDLAELQEQSDAQMCPHCNGTGEVWIAPDDRDPLDPKPHAQCQACGGTGNKSDDEPPDGWDSEYERFIADKEREALEEPDPEPEYHSEPRTVPAPTSNGNNALAPMATTRPLYLKPRLTLIPGGKDNPQRKESGRALLGTESGHDSPIMPLAAQTQAVPDILTLPSVAVNARPKRRRLPSYARDLSLIELSDFDTHTQNLARAVLRAGKAIEAAMLVRDAALFEYAKVGEFDLQGATAYLQAEKAVERAARRSGLLLSNLLFHTGTTLRAAYLVALVAADSGKGRR